MSTMRFAAYFVAALLTASIVTIACVAYANSRNDHALEEKVERMSNASHIRYDDLSKPAHIFDELNFKQAQARLRGDAERTHDDEKISVATPLVIVLSVCSLIGIGFYSETRKRDNQSGFCR